LRRRRQRPRNPCVRRSPASPARRRPREATGGRPPAPGGPVR
jgi:hypothetical protein